MFTFFAKNKLRYEKGQMVPIFIIVLVVLIIMAMVSVNLSKIAMTKTYGANGADAGALAGGATMSNLFNSIAKTNAELEAQYLFFISQYQIALIWTEIKLNATRTSIALVPGVGAVAPSAATPMQIIKMLATITAFWLAEYFIYLSMLDTAEKQHRYAKGYSYTFAFANSGIGVKLRSGDPPDDISEPNKELKEHDYQGSFSEFLNSISESAKDNTPPDSYVYAWMDGQGRDHYVRVNSTIDKPDTFELNTTLLPYFGELAIMGSALGLSYTTKADVLTTVSHGTMFLICTACCHPENPGCCSCAATEWAAYQAGVATVQSLTMATQILLIASDAGLAPGVPIEDHDGDTIFPFIICWINKAIHNFRVRVHTKHDYTNYNEADFGLWKATYPPIDSDSFVNFQGLGSIYPPKYGQDGEPGFDSDIIETDKISIED